VERHSAYARPAVAEAVCGFHVEPPPLALFSPSRPAALFDVLRDQYPQLENPSMVAMPGVGLGPAIVMGGPQFIRFSNPTSARAVTASGNMLQIHQLSPYAGWNDFKTEALRIWGLFLNAARPRSLTRATVKYTNLIPRAREHAEVGEWIKPTQAISELAVRSKTSKPFVSRTETWLDAANLLVIHLGQIQGELRSDEPPSILLDIERMTTGVSLPMHETAVADLIERLHEGVWEQFKAAQTPRLEAFLRGED